jgi:hypothetical protein
VIRSAVSKPTRKKRSTVRVEIQRRAGDDTEITHGKERQRTHDELFRGKLKLSFKI